MSRPFRAWRSVAASPRVYTLRQRYAREVGRPLACLLFLLPLLVLFQVAAHRLVRHDGALGVPQSLIHEGLAWFGLTGYWAPGLLLVVALLVWHRWRGDRWEVHGSTLALMAGESVVLAVPLLVLSLFFGVSAAAPTRDLAVRLVSELGAGIYEEFLFRLLLISGLIWLLVRVAGLPRVWALTAAVILAAIAFSWSHFQPLGKEAFDWRSFWFRLLAGVYLSVLFVGRGLGIATGSHVAYNVVLVLLT